MLIKEGCITPCSAFEKTPETCRKQPQKTQEKHGKKYLRNMQNRMGKAF